MSAPVIEATYDRPRFHVSVDGGERFENDTPAWGELLDRWREVEFAAPKEVPQGLGRLLGWIPRRRARTTAYQTGSLVVAVTVTMALSRPAASGNTVGLPLKPPVAIAHVAAATDVATRHRAAYDALLASQNIPLIDDEADDAAYLQATSGYAEPVAKPLPSG